jgi:hypothetical protein
MKRFVLFVLVAGLVLAVGSAWALTLQPRRLVGLQPPASQYR